MNKHTEWEIADVEEQLQSRFSISQVSALAILAVCHLLTLFFILNDNKIWALLFFLIHGTGFIIFYYQDTMRRDDESYMDYFSSGISVLRDETDAESFAGIAVSSIEVSSDTAGQDASDQKEASDQELLISLQEKCRSQVAQIKELTEELTKYSELKRQTEEKLSDLESKRLMESLLPVTGPNNDFVPMNIIETAQQTLDELTPYAQKAGIKVLISSSTNCLMVKADPSRIRIMFRNIIDNSIKYMRKTGSLVITISNIGGDIFIVLKDNGDGLSEAETEHVFELNYQGSNRISGNGLGLAQAKAIIHAYGGTIFAKSTLGKGMGIYIQLPTFDGSGEGGDSQ